MNLSNEYEGRLFNQLNSFFGGMGFIDYSKKKFRKKTDFGFWEIKTVFRKMKDKNIVISYMIYIRINKIEEIYAQITGEFNKKNTITGSFDLGHVMGLNTLYEQYVDSTVTEQDIFFDFEYHYLKYLKNILDADMDYNSIVESVFEKGNLSNLVNYSPLKKVAYYVLNCDFKCAISCLEQLPETMFSNKSKNKCIETINGMRELYENNS